MDQAALEVTSFLYSKFVDPLTEQPNCALVRCFKTHPFGRLPQPLREAARASLRHPDQAEPAETMRCLCLLASRGDRPEWNGCDGSEGHRAIPLATVEMVERAPMIARLLHQMGLEAGELVEPKGLPGGVERRSFDVFHVEDAVGSSFVPAQESFVKPFGVRSVIGFGGVLPSGELFAVVMFSKVRITQETASLFRTLALGVKLVLLPFAGRQVFHGN
ncbi:hypothetical protein [Granulicella rosea]|nr:hypothetical protein [Granulicella rosea]